MFIFIPSRPYEGAPPRLYRGCDEIKKDMAEIKEEISGIEAKLTVRNVLMELITAADKSDPKAWIPVLQDITADAEESLKLLNSFNDRIEELREELMETKCALGY